jgi:hypothetical protein
MTGFVDRTVKCAVALTLDVDEASLAESASVRLWTTALHERPVRVSVDRALDRTTYQGSEHKRFSD